MTKIKTLDLFCGAGGFSTGFEMTGNFEIVGGVDFERFMEKSFLENHNKTEFFQYDIRKEVPKEISSLDIDIVIGSPPCQGFSDARGVRYRLDEKNDLVLHYFNWIEKLQPTVAVMENVKGMTTIGKAWKKIDDPLSKETLDFMDFLKTVADRSNYTMQFKILNSYYYGVPQLRERVFCIMTRKDLDIIPSLPIPIDHNNRKSKTLDEFIEKDSPKITTNFEKYINPINKTSVRMAFSGLPEPHRFENGKSNTEDGYFEIDKIEAKTTYEKFVFDSNKIYNHTARFAEEDIKRIIERIPEGLTYRSDRRGSKHIGVWDLFKEILTESEQRALKEVSILRTRKNVKTKEGKHTEGYVPYLALKEEFTKDLLEQLVSKGFLQHSVYCKLREDRIKEFVENKSSNQQLKNGNKQDLVILEKLKLLSQNTHYSERGIPTYKLGIQWNTIERLRKEELIDIFECEDEYDLTTKAGLRGKFSRLGFDTQSRTLMTGFTNITELVHPSESRGLSLREGARLMSFPDSFIFYGSFAQTSLQIGNAVAPLVAYEIAKDIYSSILLKL